MTDIGGLAPEIILTGGACLILLVGAFLKPRWGFVYIGLTIFILITAAAALPAALEHGASIDDYLVYSDTFAKYLKLLLMGITALCVLISGNYLKAEKIATAEYYALLLFATVGMMLVVAARDFVLLYLGLELASLSTYVLVGIQRTRVFSSESAIKYFLLSAFSSAILLYGIALLYGLSGSFRFHSVAQALAANKLVLPPAAKAAAVLVLAGFGFKMAAVPFHMYAPDLYQGAPTSVTAFISTGPKAAAIGALVRLCVEIFGLQGDTWIPVLWVMSVLSMTLGNIAALVQQNVKRMLAYSSIAHTGYILMGLTAVLSLPQQGELRSGPASVLFYLVAYAFMTVGAFGVLLVAEKREKFLEEIDDFAGLSRKMPGSAFLMLVFLLSLGGIPLTMGFMAKFYIFASVIRAKHYWLAVLGALNSAVALFYYLRPVFQMYMRDDDVPLVESRSPLLRLTLGFSAVVVILFGIFPGKFIELARQSAEAVLW